LPALRRQTYYSRFLKALLGIIVRPEPGTAQDMRLPLKKMQLGRSGATVIEYAFVAFLISIAAFSVLVSIGSSVTGVFSSVANGF
jgi:Flp pilus assembly pilin Flp